tara:strand:- start:1644 stop:2267 length:624 start_codon:yes stop_codon:yes gene_type:complete
MKTFLTFSFSFLVLFLAAQDIRSDVDKLQSLVDNESYIEALGFADKLIANRVKEGNQAYASIVYMLRGTAKYELELETDAIVDLKMARAFNNKNYKAYYYIAAIYYKMARYSSSLENIIYFLEYAPGDVEGLILKSKCELEMGNSFGAKMTIQKALGLRSSDAELYFIRAVINAQLGEDKLACKDIKIADKFGFEAAKARIEDFCGK